MKRFIPALAAILLNMPLSAQNAPNPFILLMQKAAAHASEHHAKPPILSPVDHTVLDGLVPVQALQQAGIRVIPWTTNDPDKMRAIIRLGGPAYGIDGLISDRPDLLVRALAESNHHVPFDIEGHRGGRGLRPENTLPSFENGMDLGITTIETDTGVTTDHVSLIWHDQFLNPQSCRRADGQPYTLDHRAYIQNLSMPEAQATYICDKLHFGPDQKNDLSLSPVAVAFAAHEHLISPYVPTYVEQLFRFTRFYADYYRTGPGKSHPQAAQRAHTGDTVHFNLETKILPDRLPPEVAGQQDVNVPKEMFENHTVSPQIFVDTLCGAILRNHMESRADVQSFDFRTLQLVEEQHPTIPTVYLTDNPIFLKSAFTPEPLRQSN